MIWLPPCNVDIDIIIIRFMYKVCTVIVIISVIKKGNSNTFDMESRAITIMNFIIMIIMTWARIEWSKWLICVGHCVNHRISVQHNEAAHIFRLIRHRNNFQRDSETNIKTNQNVNTLLNIQGVFLHSKYSLSTSETNTYTPHSVWYIALQCLLANVKYVAAKANDGNWDTWNESVKENEIVGLDAHEPREEERKWTINGLKMNSKNRSRINSHQGINRARCTKV